MGRQLSEYKMLTAALFCLMHIQFKANIETVIVELWMLNRETNRPKSRDGKTDRALNCNWIDVRHLHNISKCMLSVYGSGNGRGSGSGENISAVQPYQCDFSYK